MAGKPSADMLRAMKLIKKGMTGMDAARQTGMHPTSIYRSPLYKAWRADQAQKTGASTLIPRK
jgi:hypothetical protein